MRRCFSSKPTGSIRWGERLYRQAVMVMALTDIIVEYENVNEPEEDPENEDEAVH